MRRSFELRWVLTLAVAVPGLTLSCVGQITDPGGSTRAATGGASGSPPAGTGGSMDTGTGGATPSGTGGADQPGTGGSASDGTGGAMTSGTGGATSPGTGGSPMGSGSAGAGGASPGTGGSRPGGTGGASAGTGGSSAGGAAGSGAVTPDAGTPPDPFSVAPTCTSGTTWKGGNEGSSSMNPGLACISCHKSSGGEAPTFSVAGTLYPTAHEPDLCNGFNGTAGAQVVVTGADGKSLTLTPNGAGNFSSSTSVKLPYQAKVVYMGQERAMVETQSTGDCNSCHTQNGASGAPGRILLP